MPFKIAQSLLATLPSPNKYMAQNVASLNGKTTRPKPNQVINEIVKVPQELMLAQHDVELLLTLNCESSCIPCNQP
jgi:hypothetical protein